MSLFQLGDFTLHSGASSPWKIDCDALTDEDLVALALVARKLLPMYSYVDGVPSGGLRFAKAMRRYVDSDGPMLIVDDVFTTGRSMESARIELGGWIGRPGRTTIGLVIFARATPPPWVRALFTMTP